MSLMLDLATSLVPLYVMIGLGFIAARFLGVQMQSIARFEIYIIMPFIVFGSVARVALSSGDLLAPLFIYAVAITCSFITYTIGKRIWPDKTANLAGCAGGLGNTVYFGIPVVIALFPPEILGLYVLYIMGLMLNEYTFGYYLLARGKFSVKDSLMKILKLPALYGLILGLLWNVSGMELPVMMESMLHKFIGAQTVLGMGLIGLALGGFRNLEFGPRFVSLLLSVKFLLWPALMLGLIWLDRTMLHLFSEQAYDLWIIIAFVPLAGNVLAYASDLDVYPEKAALTILISTLMAIVLIPLAVAVFVK